jgi:antirestriction protein
MSTPRIYVACLAAYNNGKLHGAWVDCVDHDTVQEAIAEVLKTSPEAGAEEYAIHDHEGFGSFKVSEWPDLEELCKLGAAIEEHGDLIADLLGHLGSKDVDSALEYLEENYAGEWDSLEDSGDLNEIPERLRSYFDFEKYARDLELGGDVFTIGNHVFWNR